MTKRQFTFFILAVTASIAAMAFSLKSGPVQISWVDLAHWLFGREVSSDVSSVLSELRAPRMAASFLVGASLALSGLVLQTLLRNPLAEPYTLGLSGGSSLGAIAALTLGLQPLSLWMPITSTVGCLIAIFLVLGLASRRMGFESRSLILLGVMISLLFGALVVFLLSFVSPNQSQTLLYWLMGEFGTSRDIWIYSFSPLFLIFIFVITLKFRALDLLALGDTRALSLGIEPRTQRVVLILLCALLTSLSVTIAGLVGFVGLVSAHIARRALKTSQHRQLMMASLLIGGTLLTIADNLGRVLPTQSEVPAGSLAALIGAPVLIWILSRRPHASLE